MKVRGKGVVKLTLHGICYTISNVYWVPEFKIKTLSVGHLHEKGVVVLFKDGVCSIYHLQKGKIADSIMSANRLFILRIEPSTTTNEGRWLQVSNTDQSTLWHHHYGHPGYKGLCTLKHKNIERSVANCTPTTTCEASNIGLFLKMGKWGAIEKVGLIHADLCGPISPTSSDHKKYLLWFIDDFSRKARSYFRLENSKTFYHFKCFKTMVEKESRMPIKCLRINRGGEFNSVEFNDFCKQHGVKRQLTTA